MGSISHIVYYVINYNCAKFGALTINSTILVNFCTNLLEFYHPFCELIGISAQDNFAKNQSSMKS